MNGPGYSVRCRACNSEHRTEIDRRLLAGESARAVASWLTEAHGDAARIPFQALANHKSEHLDVRAEAAARVEAAAPAFEAAVERVIADVGVLDDVASIGLRVARALEKAVSDPSTKPSQPIATIFAAALSNARAAVTDRHELLHGKKLEVTNTGDAAPDPEALHARLAALAARATGGTDAGRVGAAESDRKG